MPTQVDLQELSRRVDELGRQVTQLSGRFDSVATAARKREDDFGSVRAQAGRAEKLVEEVRELKRQLAEVQRELQRSTGRQTTTAAPAREVRTAINQDQIKAWVRDAVTEAIGPAGLLWQKYPQVSQALGQITPALSRLGIEVDASQVLTAIVEQILRQLDPEKVSRMFSERAKLAAQQMRARTLS